MSGHELAVVVGRESQLAHIEQTLTGHQHLVLTGRPGVGKTTLLRMAMDRARVLGFKVMRAQPHPLERDYAFGVVHQLMHPFIASMNPTERGKLLSGKAELAAAALWLNDEATFRPGEDPGEVARALCQVTETMAMEQPLVVVVDDLQWIDSASCQWLTTLLHTARNAPLSIIAARTTGVPADVDVDTLVTGMPSVTVPALEVAEAMRLSRSLRPESDTRFVAACYNASGGNPFLLRLLLTAPAGEAMGLTTERLPDWVTGQIRRAGCMDVATAMAVLGDDVTADELATLANLTTSATNHALDALEEMGLLENRRTWRFVHSIVRDAVIGAVPAGKRRLLHAAAARMLHDQRSTPERISAQLLACDFIGESWVPQVLRTGAAEALARGVPDTAARYLGRALDEPVVGVDRLWILADLGRAELWRNLDLAVEQLTQVLSALRQLPSSRATDANLVGQVLADLTLARSANGPGCTVLDQVTADLADRVPELAIAIEGLAITARLAEPGFPSTERIHRLREMADGYFELEIFADALSGFLLAKNAHSPNEAVALARRVEELSSRMSVMDMMAYLYGAITLSLTEMTEMANRSCDVLVNVGPATGQPLFAEFGHGLRGALQFKTGHLQDGIRSLRRGIAIRDRSTSGRRLLSAWEGQLVVGLLTSGNLTEAAQEVDSWGERASWTAAHFDLVWLLSARGLLRAELGDLAGAFADQMAAGDIAEAHGLRNPAMLPWRTRAAVVADRLGRTDDAIGLATEELALARRWGAAQAVGGAQTVLGRLTRDTAMLTEAVHLLELSVDKIAFAESSFYLGVTYHSARRSGKARTALRRAYRAATESGAGSLAEKSAQLLDRIAVRDRTPGEPDHPDQVPPRSCACSRVVDRVGALPGR